jgi:type II restriction enzyme
MTIEAAKQALDKIIAKGRVHFYKPIQIAEILHRDRVNGDINPSQLETYRNASKVWRDIITNQFVGRASNSSARYQDDLFNENAVPPALITLLGQENRLKNGIVEAYIYRKFSERFSQLSSALRYCDETDASSFQINDFISLFWHNPGLKRSIDKIYEIVVYALFSVLIDTLEVTVEISINPAQQAVLGEFSDFTKMVMNLSPEQPSLKLPAKLYRVGVTNAADRGLDMFANFGIAIQIKHLSLTTELAENIVSSITADRIVIVCQSSEEKLILSLLNQIGWKSRIQSIVTEKNIEIWYEKALRGTHHNLMADKVLINLREQIVAEFPATNNRDFTTFYESRGYNLLTDSFWL